MDPVNTTSCIHCNAELTPRDLTDGWCDSCGKRLPSVVRPRAAASPTPAVATSGSGKKWALVIGTAVTTLLGAAAALAAAV